MKKVLSVVLAIAMMSALAIPAFAAVTTQGDLSKEIGVKVVLTDAKDTDTKIYSADIAWDDLTFTYTYTDKLQWNPANHKYETVVANAEATKWDKTEAKVTVTNHSNDAINVTAAVAAATALDGVTADCDTKTAATIAAGVEDQYDAASKKEIKVSITGTPAKAAIETAQAIATVTLTLGEGAVV